MMRVVPFRVLTGLLAVALLLCALAWSLPSRALTFFDNVPESKQEMVLSFAPLVKQAAPAVVNIYSKRVVQYREVSPLFRDPFFQDFFRQPLGREKKRIENSLGSGVIVSEKGMIVTNYHVVKGSDAIKVLLADKREFNAKLFYKDEQMDLAVLQIESEGKQLHTPYLPIADSDSLEVGDLVLAIGNPFGIGQTVTSGIVSALARSTSGISDYQFFIQTDAAINPGNSGGALVNMHGELVGINTAIFTKSGGSNGIGFATPSNMVRVVLSGLSTKGRVVRPWLGISSQNLTKEIAESLGLETNVGVLINKVTANGPAAQADMQVGDVIMALGDKEVADLNALNYRIITQQIGEAVPVTLLRKGETVETKVTFREPPETPARDKRLLPKEHVFSGITIENLSPLVALENHMDMEETGVVITEISDQAPLARLGVAKGDIIVSLNNEPISSTSQLEALLKRHPLQPNKKQPWLVVLKREGQLIQLRFAS